MPVSGGAKLSKHVLQPSNFFAARSMEPPKDFSELLACCNARHVKAIVVGAYALAFHGAPRMTGDLDLLVESSQGNADRIIEALADFGFGNVGLSSQDFQQPDRVIQLGVAPVRVDLLTSISGVTWEEAWAGRIEHQFGGVPANFLGLEQLRTNKRTVGRHQDLADLEALDELGAP